MAKSDAQYDVVVLGQHPATYLAAARLRLHRISVLHATLPDVSSPDRLVLVNPALFSLHPELSRVKRKLKLTPLFGVKFLADEAPTASEYRSKSALACVGSLAEIREALRWLALSHDAKFATPSSLRIVQLDERGVDLHIDERAVRAKALLLGDPLPRAQRTLGLADGWEAEILHRYSFVHFPSQSWIEPSSRPFMHMSLDLRGTLCWAWMLEHGERVQLAIAQPMASTAQVPAAELLRHWADVLRHHGVLLRNSTHLPIDTLSGIDLPLAGALAQEGVANRTLLIGPAGGFYSASAEDIYPNCWSALFAADVLKKALREPHLQDALQAYPHKWRTTLGNYLRGPQQNLRFLLPLVYRNAVMTQRLAESILLGKSVVR